MVDAAHSYASEAATSVMLYLYSHLADTEKIIDEPRQKRMSYTKSGIVGYATKGSKKRREDSKTGCRQICGVSK